jgi:nitrogen fixation/metabolism regulation signal transduction histidine kinase
MLKDTHVKEYLSDIFYNLERIEKTVENFRYLFYEKEVITEKIDMKTLLTSIETLFAGTIKERIGFKTRIDASVKISVNYNALTHILINLIKNAIDAIPCKGE